MKYVVIPYIEAIESKGYKEILNQRFDLSMLYSSKGEEDSTLLSGWEGMEMAGGWYKLENYEDKLTLEFYTTHYHILRKKNLQIKYCFPLCLSLNDFVSDCTRCNVPLWWNENAIKKHLPKILLSPTDIDAYYKEVLIKIDKS